MASRPVVKCSRTAVNASTAAPQLGEPNGRIVVIYTLRELARHHVDSGIENVDRRSAPRALVVTTASTRPRCPSWEHHFELRRWPHPSVREFERCDRELRADFWFLSLRSECVEIAAAKTKAKRLVRPTHYLALTLWRPVHETIVGAPSLPGAPSNAHPLRWRVRRVQPH